MKTYVIAFSAAIVFVQVICLSICFFAEEASYLGFLFEFASIPLIVAFLQDLFRRCPVCGKRSLTTFARCSGSKYNLYDAECRNCHSKIGIEYNRSTGKFTYFSKNGHLDDKVISPV